MKPMRLTALRVALFLLVATNALADKEWSQYGGNQGNERHVELTKITKANVAQLVPRSVLQLSDIAQAMQPLDLGS